MPKNSVNQVLINGYFKYNATHKIPSHHQTAAKSLMSCRTAVLGGHVQACPDNHFQRVWYNSCKHRLCPQCAYLQIENWLNRQKSRILSCDHFHVIFTIPCELRFLLHMNFKLLAAILFACSRDVIFELTKDSKRLGALPGIISGMHTWTRTLDIHPHIHCLVTGGGMTDLQEWNVVKGSYLFPFAVARDLFRGKVNACLLKAVKKGELILPSHMSKQKFLNLLNRLGRKKWNVKICEKYAHGQGVATYLARYLRGGPISNSRIKSINDTHVIFSYGRKKMARMQLPISEFINRYLAHTPPANTVMIRSYGLYSHTKKEALNNVRRLLGQADVDVPARLAWQDAVERQDATLIVCPVCHKRLVVISKFRACHEANRIMSRPP